jgi:hypothetical protein
MKWFGLAAILFAGFLPVSTQRRTARTERGIALPYVPDESRIATVTSRFATAAAIADRAVVLRQRR